MCFSGVWGTICHNGWNDDDATVVCRQLGYRAEGMSRMVWVKTRDVCWYLCVSCLDILQVVCNEQNELLIITS